MGIIATEYGKCRVQENVRITLHDVREDVRNLVVEGAALLTPIGEQREPEVCAVLLGKHILPAICYAREGRTRQCVIPEYNPMLAAYVSAHLVPVPGAEYVVYQNTTRFFLKTAVRSEIFNRAEPVERMPALFAPLGLVHAREYDIYASTPTIHNGWQKYITDAIHMLPPLPAPSRKRAWVDDGARKRTAIATFAAARSLDALVRANVALLGGPAAPIVADDPAPAPAPAPVPESKHAAVEVFATERSVDALLHATMVLADCLIAPAAPEVEEYCNDGGDVDDDGSDVDDDGGDVDDDGSDDIDDSSDVDDGGAVYDDGDVSICPSLLSEPPYWTPDADAAWPAGVPELSDSLYE